MRHRFVPSYYARELLNKMQRFQQGQQSVEEKYQELQKGMIRCGLCETDDAAMARFRGGLNREIQDILDYKDYADMTTLFESACKAEREVQARRELHNLADQSIIVSLSMPNLLQDDEQKKEDKDDVKEI